MPFLLPQGEEIQKQSEALREQSQDLGFSDQDFAKLQAEVQKDFGIQVDIENKEKRQAQDLQAVLTGNAGSRRTDGRGLCWARKSF